MFIAFSYIWSIALISVVDARRLELTLIMSLTCEKISTFERSSLYWQILLWSVTSVSSPEFSVFSHLLLPASFTPSGFWKIASGIVH